MKKFYVAALVFTLVFIAGVNAQGQVKTIDFGKDNYAGWKSATVEAKKKVSGDIMHFIVMVDHKKNAKGKNTGEFLKGWPRLCFYLKPTVDLSKYSKVTFEYKLKTTQPAGEKTLIYIYFQSADEKYTYSVELTRDDKGHKATILIKDFIAKSKKPAAAWSSANMFQIGLAESNYADGTKIDVQLRNIKLQ